MTRKPRVLFVCHGNLNRSAAAEVLARQWDDWEVKSAGLRGVTGALMPPRMRNLLGVRDFRSTALSEELLEWADMVVAFTPHHERKLWNMTWPDKVTRITHYLPQYSGVTTIPDPHFDTTGESHAMVVATILAALPELHRAALRLELK